MSNNKGPCVLDINRAKTDFENLRACMRHEADAPAAFHAVVLSLQSQSALVSKLIEANLFLQKRVAVLESANCGGCACANRKAA